MFALKERGQASKNEKCDAGYPLTMSGEITWQDCLIGAFFQTYDQRTLNRVRGYQLSKTSTVLLVMPSLRSLKIDLGASKRAAGFLELSNVSAVSACVKERCQGLEKGKM